MHGLSVCEQVGLYVLLWFCVDVVGVFLSVVCCVVLFVVIPFSFILILFIVGC